MVIPLVNILLLILVKFIQITQMFFFQFVAHLMEASAINQYSLGFLILLVELVDMRFGLRLQVLHLEEVLPTISDFDLLVVLWEIFSI